MSIQTTEQRFHRALINIYEVAKRDCHYTATCFLQIVLDPDGGGEVGAAKRLLSFCMRYWFSRNLCEGPTPTAAT